MNCDKTINHSIVFFKIKISVIPANNATKHVIKELSLIRRIFKNTVLRLVWFMKSSRKYWKK